LARSEGDHRREPHPKKKKKVTLPEPPCSASGLPAAGRERQTRFFRLLIMDMRPRPGSWQIRASGPAFVLPLMDRLLRADARSCRRLSFNILTRVPGRFTSDEARAPRGHEFAVRSMGSGSVSPIARNEAPRVFGVSTAQTRGMGPLWRKN